MMNLQFRSSLLACLLLGGMGLGSAEAQVFRCTNASGGVSFSDAPCQGSHKGEMIEGKRSVEDIQAEREQARRAIDEKQRVRQAENERVQQDLQRQSLEQQKASKSARPSAGPPAQCIQAQKELEFVSSIRMISDDEKRMRMNSAITQVNAACGTHTPLMKEPDKIIVQPYPYLYPEPNRNVNGR